MSKPCWNCEGCGYKVVPFHPCVKAERCPACFGDGQHREHNVKLSPTPEKVFNDLYVGWDDNDPTLVDN